MNQMFFKLGANVSTSLIEGELTFALDLGDGK